MIDEKYQGKGYGKAAMQQVIELIRTKPQDREAKYVYTSYLPDNHIASKVYASVGFEKTGHVSGGGEDIVRLTL